MGEMSMGEHIWIKHNICNKGLFEAVSLANYENSMHKICQYTFLSI